MSVNSVQMFSTSFNAQSSSARTVDSANESIIKMEQMKSLLYLGVRGEIPVEEIDGSEDFSKGYRHTVDLLV